MWDVLVRMLDSPGALPAVAVLIVVVAFLGVLLKWRRDDLEAETKRAAAWAARDQLDRQERAESRAAQRAIADECHAVATAATAREAERAERGRRALETALSHSTEAIRAATAAIVEQSRLSGETRAVLTSVRSALERRRG